MKQSKGNNTCETGGSHQYKETQNSWKMSQPTPEQMQQKVALHRKFGYGMGHVLNDMCATMWFTYLLIFFREVIGIIRLLLNICTTVQKMGMANPMIRLLFDCVAAFQTTVHFITTGWIHRFWAHGGRHTANNWPICRWYFSCVCGIFLWQGRWLLAVQSIWESEGLAFSWNPVCFLQFPLCLPALH